MCNKNKTQISLNFFKMNNSRNSACLAIYCQKQQEQSVLWMWSSLSTSENVLDACTTFGCGWKLNNGAATTGGKSRRRRQRRAGVGYGKLLGRGAFSLPINTVDASERVSLGAFQSGPFTTPANNCRWLACYPPPNWLHARPRRRSQIFLTHTRAKT